MLKYRRGRHTSDIISIPGSPDRSQGKPSPKDYHPFPCNEAEEAGAVLGSGLKKMPYWQSKSTNLRQLGDADSQGQSSGRMTLEKTLRFHWGLNKASKKSFLKFILHH